MATELNIRCVEIIADNRYGWQYVVGLLGDRWIGAAVSQAGQGQRILMLLPEVAEGVELGLVDKTEAIRLTAALAQDPERYGGVDRWLIHESLRGDPEAYRCRSCGRVGCQGECEDMPFGDLTDGDFPF